MSARPLLVIGNKRYSSWSLRAWLALKHAGIDFEERLLALDTPEYAGQIAPLSPTARVPVLHVDGVAVWDSLAIFEWAAEAAPDAGLWPADPSRRAIARSLCCTMHSGFSALRREAPMNLGREGEPKTFSDKVSADVAQLEALWRDYRAGEGPWFFGGWSLVDAAWTPVATRLRSYAVAVEPAAAAYVDTLLDDPHYRAWRADALAETLRIAATEEA
jgi:glutathione S-transferase